MADTPVLAAGKPRSGWWAAPRCQDRRQADQMTRQANQTARTYLKPVVSVFVVAMTTTCLTEAAVAAHFGGGGSMVRGAPSMFGTALPTPIQPKHMATPKALGQPNQSCGSASAPNTPGNSASAPGLAFNPNGVAGTHYAEQQPQNSRNPASASQYDVACANQPH